MPFVTRDEFYAQVWAEPMRAVAKPYFVSFSYLARVCNSLRDLLGGPGAGQALSVPPDPSDEYALSSRQEFPVD